MGKKEKRRQVRRASFTGIFCLGVFLTGCTARELESRRFPLALEIDARDGQLVFACGWPQVSGGTEEKQGSGEEESAREEETEDVSGNKEPQEVNTPQITRVLGASIGEAVQNVQKLQEKYVDYSQVKAILWGDGLEADAALRQQVLSWLEGTPEFARSLLIFTGRKPDLEEVQKQAQGQPGVYLENLYRNNKAYRRSAKTLEEVLYADGE